MKVSEDSPVKEPEIVEEDVKIEEEGKEEHGVLMSEYEK